MNWLTATPPGCRHTKRYQDVEELLQAGINVYTTVNVQHLESLNDLVTSITGIVVNERIPDHVFDRANQVELVDIAPLTWKSGWRREDLPAAPGEAGAGEFFHRRESDGPAEIAMRRTADQLNPRQHREKEGRRGGTLHFPFPPPPPRQGDPHGRPDGRGVPQRLHGALCPDTGDQELSGENIKRLRSNLRLAEQLGAQIATVYGADPAEQIAEYARVSGITKIVMGRVNHRQHPWIGAEKSGRPVDRADGPGCVYHSGPPAAL